MREPVGVTINRMVLDYDVVLIVGPGRFSLDALIRKR